MTSNCYYTAKLKFTTYKAIVYEKQLRFQTTQVGNWSLENIQDFLEKLYHQNTHEKNI